MNAASENLISATKQLSVPQRREILARLWSDEDLNETGKVWKSVRLSAKLRVAAYAPEQEIYLQELRELLIKGALARIEGEKDGTCEIYGADRTYYVAMSPERDFAALLDSWLPFEPPREINLEDNG